MSPNDDFDQTLRAWLHRQAPPQAPDRVLDAALERVAGESQRRSWLQRLFGGTTMTLMIRTAAVAAVAAVAALIGLQISNLNSNVGNTPSPIPSVTTGPTDSATPSSTPSAGPGAAALVLQLSGAGEAGPLHLVTILEDGRVITSDPSGVNLPTERRLTTEGIQLVRDEMAATGLTDASANYYPVANPGKDLVYGGAGPVLEVGQPDGDDILINWYLFADTELDLAAPQPESEVLEALAIRLTTLEDWLPASAWADASAAPFEPERYLMVIDVQPLAPGDTWVDIASVSWPLEVGIDAFGQLSDPPIDDVRTGCLGAADGRAVIAALSAAGAGVTGEAEFMKSFVLGDGDRKIWITVSPILTTTTSC